jgi:hypothetical protein
MTIRMCRYVPFLVGVMSLAVCANADAQNLREQWLAVKTGPAAVLLDPSPSSVVVATVERGTRVQAQRLQDGWYLVRVPKAVNELAPVSGWVPEAMLSPVSDLSPSASAALMSTPVIVGGATSTPRMSEGAPSLAELRSQRDKVDAAIRALGGLSEAEGLRVRRDKLDRAIQATEALAVNDGPFGVDPLRSAAAPASSANGSATIAPAPSEQAPPASTYSGGTGHRQLKEGFWFSGGLGVGSLGCDGCEVRQTGVSGGLSLGGTINDRLLVGAGTTGWAKTVDGETITVGTLDARLRFYPTRTSGFFLTGGLGFGAISVAGESENGIGVVIGIGWDIRVGSNVSLTPFYNGFAMRSSLYDANVGQFGLGVTIH